MSAKFPRGGAGPFLARSLKVATGQVCHRPQSPVLSCVRVSSFRSGVLVCRLTGIVGIESWLCLQCLCLFDCSVSEVLNLLSVFFTSGERTAF